MASGWLGRQATRLEGRAPWTRRITGPFRRHRWLRVATYVSTAGFVLALVGLAVLWSSLELPDEPPRPQSAVVLSADGGELATFSSEGLHFDKPLDEIAPVAVKAVLAAEDRRYYQHTGIDPFGIARAVWRDLRGAKQGGSTITQQLVKVDYLTRERSFTRKVKEAVLAVKLERTADKDEILARYLNTVYFGRRAYGIEAAARAYFDTSAAALGPGQAALLAGLIRAPETADPSTAPEEATLRRKLVLDAMAQEGVITEAEARRLDAEPLGAVDPALIDAEGETAPHFVDHVRAEAVRAIGPAAVEGSGVKIITTLDLRMQQSAEAAVAEVLRDEPGPQAALVALDTDGAVRAWVGGRDHDTLKLDLVRGADGGGSGRQPGSTFKPFVLAAALSRGATLGEQLPAPATLDLEVDGRPWSVDNYENKGYGSLDLLKATADSVNTVYAQLLQRVGPKAVAETATAFGITTPLEPVPALALGSAETSPLDIARAYATLANDGMRTDPYVIDRIESADGTVIWRAPRPEPARAVEPDIARAVTHALEGVIGNGTGKRAKLDRPVAGKTGTTQNNVDAWFAGYVPGFTAVVWMGNTEGGTMTTTAGAGITGGGLPATIWQRFMSAAVEGRKPDAFPRPPDELLEAPPPPTLVADPERPEPGGLVNVAGEGFETCQASWSVVLEGTLVASAPELGSTSDRRSAGLTLPAELPPGRHRIIAMCDDGTGAKPVAETAIELELRLPPLETTTTTTETTTTTSTTTSTTTTTTAPEGQTVQESSQSSGASTTTTSPPTTTTTTKPPKRR